ncbi:MAG: hypothetical protein HOK21_03255 [Rhodospirillaceae bacterium]|nr:hypothetical protein [Rhodospirillaceae bacterium]MBT4689755.1 hypothetical protein [Rhodospirillaceae bacterium]MBT5083809.1 hypothetical protein [Rhodospirillaceae bacterium]MBT5523079.1 hypothetical protein [Rhodospirillaceae bacterium]MBT5877635.1 hypothetical protein [Rhodospirillaceae bacterium]
MPSGLCFWHDPDCDKSGPNIRQDLEDVARSGASLSGFRLARADLRDINLNRGGSKEGYDLSKADLYRADLRGAHLFQANLTDASLMKAHLEEANLNHSILRGANLLGVVLGNAKTEHADWGQKIRQHHEADAARAAGERAAEISSCTEAEEIYRNLRKQSESTGHFETAGAFFVLEMTMRRYQMRALSLSRLFSKTVDLFCGYGERPFRVVLVSISVILSCALLYFAFGITDHAGIVIFDPATGLAENSMSFLNVLYFSVVTFTTLGYGDMSPIGITRLIAASEAFLGAFVLALFVVVFVKKMTR